MIKDMSYKKRAFLSCLDPSQMFQNKKNFNILGLCFALAETVKNLILRANSIEIFLLVGCFKCS
jgi:hypothetical protein